LLKHNYQTTLQHLSPTQRQVIHRLPNINKSPIPTATLSMYPTWQFRRLIISLKSGRKAAKVFCKPNIDIHKLFVVIHQLNGSFYQLSVDIHQPFVDFYKLNS